MLPGSIRGGGDMPNKVAALLIGIVALGFVAAIAANYSEYTAIYECSGMTTKVGQFSTISNSLWLNISDEEVFSGTCTPKNN